MTETEKKEIDSLLLAIDEMIEAEEYALASEVIYQQRKKLAAPNDAEVASPNDAKDAARYRQLRKHSYIELRCDSPRIDGWTPDKLDAAIDAWINGDGPQSPK